MAINIISLTYGSSNRLHILSLYGYNGALVTLSFDWRWCSKYLEGMQRNSHVTIETDSCYPSAADAVWCGWSVRVSLSAAWSNGGVDLPLHPPLDALFMTRQVTRNHEHLAGNCRKRVHWYTHTHTHTTQWRNPFVAHFFLCPWSEPMFCRNIFPSHGHNKMGFVKECSEATLIQRYK